MNILSDINFAGSIVLSFENYQLNEQFLQLLNYDVKLNSCVRGVYFKNCAIATELTPELGRVLSESRSIDYINLKNDSNDALSFETNLLKFLKEKLISKNLVL